MKKNIIIISIVACCLIAFASTAISAQGDIKLSQPSLSSDVSIEKALNKRRSLREYKDAPVSLKELTQLLWAGQGITDEKNGFRTAPSGMASYPLNLYAITFNVTGVPQGLYRYEPKGHELILVSKGDKREAVTDARFSGPPPGVSGDAAAEATTKMASHANPLPTAPLIFIITSKSKGGGSLEAGHVAQNILLQCVSLDMGGVPMGGIDFDKLKKALNIDENEEGIYLIPVGKK